MRINPRFSLPITPPEKSNFVNPIEKAASMFIYAMLFLGMTALLYVILA